MSYKIVFSGELFHHGVLGQRKGVRNGPPYPLDRSISTGSALILDKEIRREKRDLNRDYVPIHSSMPLRSVNDFFDIALHEIRYRRSTPDAKIKDFFDKYKDITVDKIQNESQIPLIQGEHTADDDMRIINNSGDFYKAGRSQNCALCSVAYDLRRRGYDVVAGNRYEPMTMEEIQSMFKGRLAINYIDRIAKTTKIDAKKVRSTMETYTKVGDRGVFTAATRWITGHCIAFDHTEDGIVFRDCQSNEVMSNSDLNAIYEFRSRYAYFDNPATYIVTSRGRMDLESMLNNGYLKVRTAP